MRLNTELRITLQERSYQKSLIHQGLVDEVLPSEGVTDQAKYL